MTMLNMTRRDALGIFGAALAAHVAAAPLTAATAAESVMLFFDFGKKDLPASAKPLVEAIKSLIKPNAQVLLTGHCDNAEAKPDVLALARAVEALKQLSAAGLPAGVRVTVTSAANTRPLVPTAANMREPQNRRVEVTVG